MLAEEPFDAGARPLKSGARGVRGVRRDGERLEQCLVALGEIAGSRQCAGVSEQELHPLLRRRHLREQAQRLREPVCSVRRCEPRRRLARLAKEGDGGKVALPRGPLDVMCARDGRRAARRECIRTPLVRAEPPRGGGCLVDGSADERVTEAEPPRNFGRADEVESHQPVEGINRRGLRGRGGGGRKLRLEGIARHGCSFEHRPLPSRGG